MCVRNFRRFIYYSEERSSEPGFLVRDQFLPERYVRRYLWVSARLITKANLYLILKLFQLYS